MTPWWLTLLLSLSGVVAGGLISLLQPLLKARLDREHKQLEADLRRTSRRREQADDAVQHYHRVAHDLLFEVDTLYEWATDADGVGAMPDWSSYGRRVSETYVKLRELKAAATALRFHYGPDQGLTEGIKRLTIRFAEALDAVSGLSPDHFPIHQRCGEDAATEKVVYLREGFAQIERLIQERDSLEGGAAALRAKGLLAE